MTATGQLPGGGQLAQAFGRDPAVDSGQPKREGNVPGLLAPRGASDGGMTGLNPKQESGALGYMFGGGK